MQSRSIRNQWLRLFAVACLLALIDQLCKGLVRSRLAPGTHLPILDQILQISYVRNYRGFSWWVPPLPSWATGVLDLLLLLIVLGAIPFYLFYTQRWRESRWARIAAVGVTGGAFGHLLDNFFAPYTTDFIQILDWPSANLADLYSYIGIGALTIEWISMVWVGRCRWQGIRPFLTTAVQIRREFFGFLLTIIKDGE